MLRLVTTADTEILAAAAAVDRLPAGFPEVRCANPGGVEDHDALVEEIMAGARVVLCRILGGRRGWPEGFDLLRARCAERDLALIALGGELEPDAELAGLSLAPPGAVAQAGEYLRHGDVDNVEQLLRFLADTFLLEGYGFAAPRAVPDLGVYVPGRGDVAIEDALADHDPGRPTVAVCFYRSHRLTGNTDFVDALCAAIEDAGANALAVWSYTLRRAPDGRVPALDLLRGRVDALITTMLATGGSGASDAAAAEGPGVGEAWQEWDAAALAALDVPVIQAVCATVSRAAWLGSDTGLTPLDAATQVAIPEFDGRVLGGVISFKERDGHRSRVGVPVARYRPDRERCARVARLAVRSARLRATPAAAKRVAVLLTSFPTRHARVGNAVGLDTPASAIALLEALAGAGIDVRHPYADGDALMHALIASGGHDPEFLTDAQLAAAPLRMPVADYAEWFATLPAGLREAVEGRWGPAPGEQFVDGEDFVVAGLELGNVVVAIQPPRGYGEDPVALYHDPRLPPTHHYLACYRWLDRVWGADAIVHLGKHGTLEWLPGKMLALSAACAPDAALGDIPLVYPFVVNDPGEGVQAKRRAHAVIVDHLVPPMMRAETYDELAELEALLDEYARLEVLDPGKLPALAARIWGAIEAANLQADLGVEARPDDVGALVEHIDGYLCEVKDIQIKDGLHVLGRPPQGEQLLGLSAAIMRLGSGDVIGLRRAVGAAFGLDEAALVQAPGAPAPPGAPGVADLLRRFPGPGATAGDLVDRLELAQRAVLGELERRGWATGAVGAACRAALGRGGAELERSLDLVAREVVPRLGRTTEELDHVLDALGGRFVPAGPSGSPTRGRLDVLPDRAQLLLGRPPGAARPSWPGRSAAGWPTPCCERYLRENGAYPRTVGLVAWGTAAMRTHGDDVAEILALLGVRPRLEPESRRVIGLEVDARWRSSAGPASTSRCASRASSATPSRTWSTCSTRRWAPWPGSTSRRSATSCRARPRGRRAPGRRARRERRLAPGHDADLRLQARGLRRGPAAAHRRPATGATTPTSPRSTMAWGGFAYGRGLDGAEAQAAMRGLLRAHRGGRQEPSTTASTTSSTRTTTPVPRRHDRHHPRPGRPRAAGLSRRHAPIRRGRWSAPWPRRAGGSSAPAWSTRGGSRR